MNRVFQKIVLSINYLTYFLLIPATVFLSEEDDEEKSSHRPYPAPEPQHSACRNWHFYRAYNWWIITEFLRLQFLRSTPGNSSRVNVQKMLFFSWNSTSGPLFYVFPFSSVMYIVAYNLIFFPPPSFKKKS